MFLILTRVPQLKLFVILDHELLIDGQDRPEMKSRVNHYFDCYMHGYPNIYL